MNVLRNEELEDVILTGHSYGGMVITGVADRMPDRVRALVYVDSPVPRDSDSLFSLFPGIAATGEEAARQVGEGWLVPPDESIVGDRRVASFSRGHYGPQPIETMRQPIRLTPQFPGRIPRIYLLQRQRPG